MLLMKSFVYAQDTRGMKLIKIFNRGGEEIGLYKESHALLIGVSNYTAGWPKLPRVRDDIKALIRHITFSNPSSMRVMLFSFVT